VLAQALGDQRQGERGAVDGHRNLAEQIRQGADVVLVAVRQDDGAEGLAPGKRVGEIRDHVVDARQLVVREHEPAVDREQVLAGLDQHHVEADLAETSERDQSDDGLHGTPFTKAA
jgi:hypothetical protein